MTTWAFDARGAMVEQDNWNGTRLTVAYDTLGRAASERHSKNDGSLLTEASYLRDAMGNPLLRRTEQGLTTWTYDAADRLIGEAHRLAAVVEDPRSPEMLRHQLCSLFQQRIYQVASDYEDCNDAQTLRHDPLLKTALVLRVCPHSAAQYWRPLSWA